MDGAWWAARARSTTCWGDIVEGLCSRNAVAVMESSVLCGIAGSGGMRGTGGWDRLLPGRARSARRAAARTCWTGLLQEPEALHDRQPLPVPAEADEPAGAHRREEDQHEGVD